MEGYSGQEEMKSLWHKPLCQQKTLETQSSNIKTPHTYDMWGKRCRHVISRVWSTAKHIFFTRTVFSRKFARSASRNNKVFAYEFLCHKSAQEIDCDENKVLQIYQGFCSHK